MAQIFIAAIYGINQNATSNAAGQYIGFPSQGVLVRPVLSTDVANGTFNGVTVNSIIQLLPSGTVVVQPQFYSDRTVAQIATLANA